MNITRSKSPFLSKYTLHGQTLETVKEAKYLGVTISNDLSWNSHINQISTKAGQTLNFLKRNIPSKNQKVREFAYKSLVRPKLEYACSVWSPHTQQNTHKLEMVQRRAARWVKHDYSSYSSVTSMINSLHWRLLEHRRLDARLCMFYKIVYGLVAVPIPSYVIPPRRLSRNLHSLSFQPLHTVNNYYKYAFYPATIVLWNSLPLDMVQIPTLDHFKDALQNYNYIKP